MKNDVKINVIAFKPATEQDIRNAEKFSKRSGKIAEEAYSLLDEKVSEVKSGVQTIFLSIPGSTKDMFEIIVN